MKKFRLPRITWIIWIITAVVGVVLIAAYGHAFRREYNVTLKKASSGNYKIRVYEDPGDMKSVEPSPEPVPELEPEPTPQPTPEPTPTPEPEEPLVEEEPAAPPKYVALTFDDGPSEKATLRILATLEEYGARATFFAVGYNISPFKDHLKRELEIGCEVANHTSNHPHLTKLSKDQMKKEINDNEALIRKVCDLPEDQVVLLRPPYGEYNQTVLDMLTMPAVCWSLDSLDWKSRNCDAIVQLVESKVEDGSIILMHDLYDSTAEAVDILVPWFIENGYELVTVSELYEQKGEELRPGHVYSKADQE